MGTLLHVVTIPVRQPPQLRGYTCTPAPERLQLTCVLLVFDRTHNLNLRTCSANIVLPPSGNVSLSVKLYAVLLLYVVVPLR